MAKAAALVRGIASQNVPDLSVNHGEFTTEIYSHALIPHKRCQGPKVLPEALDFLFHYICNQEIIVIVPPAMAFR